MCPPRDEANKKKQMAGQNPRGGAGGGGGRGERIPGRRRRSRCEFECAHARRMQIQLQGGATRQEASNTKEGAAAAIAVAGEESCSAEKGGTTLHRDRLLLRLTATGRRTAACQLVGFCSRLLLQLLPAMNDGRSAHPSQRARVRGETTRCAARTAGAMDVTWLQLRLRLPLRQPASQRDSERHCVRR